ncbi:hypothetical protein OKW40_005675 [Paraburkholderia sp. RAU6.4a]|uniref:TniQ family protein n=1 Tax=Paraburkholderia sp. RAU6.4a TaxID=2991067 RepID=UPI003D1BCEA4
MNTDANPIHFAEGMHVEDHPMSGGFSDTALYPLIPIAFGTPLSESSVSYLCRLASAHHVAVDVLVNQVLARYCDDDFAIWRHFSTWKRSAAINIFTTRRTTQLLSALKMATGVVALENLSLGALGEVCDLRGASSDIQRHCPQCYAKDLDWRRSYRPLLWDLKLVRVCPEHGVALMPSVCGAARRSRLSLWNRHHISGACSTCGSIGYQCAANEEVSVSDSDVWVAQELGDVVARVTSGETFLTGNVHRSVMHLASLIGDGYPYRTASICGISKARLFDWINQKKLIRLAPLVALCAAAGISLLDALRGEVGASGKRVSHKYSPVRGSGDAVSPLKRDDLIRDAGRDSACPSLASVARSIGLSTKYLSQCYPVEAREIVCRHRKAQHRRTLQRQLEADQLIAGVAAELRAQGFRVTKRNIWLRTRIMVTSQSRFEKAWMKLHEASVDIKPLTISESDPDD